MKKNMFKIIKKLISFFICLYNLYKFIFFNCFVGKQLTYQAEISSTKSNDEFELINQKHNSIVTVSVKDTNKDKAKSLYENKRRAEKIKNEQHLKKITNTLPSDEPIVKLKNVDSILEKSVFDLEPEDWDILYLEMSKHIKAKPDILC
ncbi:uncharacterized protein LOC132933572 [Metopolophium dirhodum]|uniref:uncharacterized protein LOC132933572 n=1 Tax=Metopolophium dirhodum TaxID=44670 RepID=UPI0029906B43|nr:uncharacterized protein LOC132933572 [Metopolophium dirhodum]